MASDPSPLTLSATSKNVTVPTGLFIANTFVSGSGSSIESTNPATEELLGSVQGASKEDVDKAVAAARRAFEDSWGTNVAGTERARLLLKLAELMERDTDELALVESLDAGKPITMAKFDIADSIGCLRYYAGLADKISGRTLELGDPNKTAFTFNEPVGVVGQIVPWNYPILMWSWKVAPALAAGCTIVFKPAENTPLSTLKLCELFVEAGFPPGVFNVVNGLGAVAGQAIAEHSDIDKVAFTGSTAVGRQIAVAAAQSNLKKVTLELGGKSPHVVFESADLEQAVNWAALGIFENMGQSCTAGSRVIVHESIHDEFVEKFVEAAERHQVGDPLDEKTFQGPQVSKVQFDRILGFLKAGQDEGAKVVTGGKRKGSKGYFVEPTVFTGVKDDMKIVKEEIFGPVLVVIPFKTEEDAVRIANSTSYGLAAGIQSKDGDQVMRVSKKLKAGTVWINSYAFLSNNVPFGGYKQSGWGRELGAEGLQAYLNTKAVHWNHGEKLSWPIY